MFEHSVKVPRHYKIAANIFKKVSTEGGSVKTLLYDDKLRHFRTNVLYALITETIKHAADIDKIFKSSGLLEAEPRLDPYLAKVLTTEILFGKKVLPGKSKPEQTILSYKDKFQKYIVENDGDLKSKVRRPRYVRINTNLLTTSDAIRAFQDEGYKFIRCTAGSYDDYLQQIQSLTEYDFTQDYHVKTIFVFSSGTKLHEHELYWENKIILQDKATALPVHLLAPPPGSVVLDLCAAPGMKTTQLAAYLRNQGKIYAIERNEQRYQTLCEFVERTDSKCVETVLKDSLDIKRGDYDDVEYILLDPSCSGSGMDFSVHSYVEDTRLAKLTSLQEKFLKHAMNSFPKVKRIVYSTCSLFPEENERVITNVVKTSRAKWRVQDVGKLLKGQWNNFGSGMYGSMGTRCLYAKPDTDFTTGFFLAVLDRDQKDLEKSYCVNGDAETEEKYTENEYDQIIETNPETWEGEYDNKKNYWNGIKREKECQDPESVLDETVCDDFKTNTEIKKETTKTKKSVEDVADKLEYTNISNMQDVNEKKVSHDPTKKILEENQGLLEPKKKKKKKDRGCDIIEIDCYYGKNIDESINYRKFKHEEKEKKYSHGIEDIIDNTETSERKRKHLESQIYTEEIDSSKKEDENYTHKIEATTDFEETSEISKKKKKKKHSETPSIYEEIENSKKNNKKHSHKLEDTIDNTETSEKSKNKQQKKHPQTLVNNKLIENAETGDKNYTNKVAETKSSEKPNKKHKKKCPESSINSENVEIGKTTVKKYTNEIYETLDNTKSSEESKKKKKYSETPINAKEIENGREANKTKVTITNTEASVKSIKKRKHLESQIYNGKMEGGKKNDAIYTNEIGETIDILETPERSKKKKKTKHSETAINIEEIENLTKRDKETDGNKQTSKKSNKKQKGKHSEIPINTEEIENVKTKDKSHLNEEETIDNTKSSEKSNKKKKRKHSETPIDTEQIENGGDDELRNENKKKKKQRSFDCN